VTLRDETEWVETVEAGWNRLVDCDRERIARTALQVVPFQGPRSLGTLDPGLSTRLPML